MNVWVICSHLILVCVYFFFALQEWKLQWTLSIQIRFSWIGGTWHSWSVSETNFISNCFPYMQFPHIKFINIEISFSAPRKLHLLFTFLRGVTFINDLHSFTYWFQDSKEKKFSLWSLKTTFTFRSPKNYLQRLLMGFLWLFKNFYQREWVRLKKDAMVWGGDDDIRGLHQF